MDQQRRAYLIEAATQAQPYPREAALARAWLEEYLDEYDDIDWQKHVGLGISLGPDYEPSIQRMAYQATRKRVDLVAYHSTGVTLIELKDHVDLAAVRQAAEYEELWRISPINPPVLAVVVVGRTGDAGIAQTADALGVIVELLSSISA